jgi:hypothetical protein
VAKRQENHSPLIAIHFYLAALVEEISDNGRAVTVWYGPSLQSAITRKEGFRPPACRGLFSKLLFYGAKHR